MNNNNFEGGLEDSIGDFCRFGILTVSGRNLVPSPAAKIIEFISVFFLQHIPSLHKLF